MTRHYSTPSRRALFAVLATAALAACATNPVTGKREIALISEGQEIEMGKQAAGEVAASIGLVNDQALQSYVQNIGAQLAAKSERPGLPWSFGVVDDPSPNAFALPGGFIFVTRGMLGLMDNEAELASVLGHEIGHVTARHSVSQMSKTQLAQLGLGVGMIFSETLRNYGDLAGQGLGLLFLKYGRDDERQADELGFKYALTDGYDVRQMADVFRSLQRIGEASGQSPLPTWMASHPDPGERVQTAEKRVAALAQPQNNARLDEAEYMQRIDGMTYGTNPRQGFFEGTTFYHPDLRFRFAFPQGWKTQNLTQAVVAVSPQQDAVMQLTIVQGTPEDVARKFLSQQGLQAEQVTRETINGIPAVAGYFQAQTEQGVVRGLATFMSYGNSTYQVMAYAPQQAFPQHDRAIRQALGSFAQVTDSRVLTVQPNTVDIVRLSQNMTLAQFNQQYPSVVSLDELALINQLSSTSETIPSGAYVKRVTKGSGG